MDAEIARIVADRRSLTVMAGLVSAIHGLRVDPAEVVDASMRWHDGDQLA